MTISRRRFLGAAGAAGALAASGGLRTTARALATPRLAWPNPVDSGIDHIVVVMMENRSFDHFLGWMPGADGVQAGLSYPDGNGNFVATHPLAPEWSGCAHPDPDHSWEGGRHQYNNGALDGFASGNNDDFAVGYYVEADRPFMSALARNFTPLDRYFCSILAETFPNRFFMHAATSDRRHNNGVASTVISPTIWDRLAAANVSATYYFSDLPFIGLWGQKYLPISRPYPQFIADAVTGNLPAVSFVDPRFEDEGSGTSGDDHPHADIRAGDHFLAEIYHALAAGKWANTLLVVNYDEWGGFYDHVLPPRAANSVAPEVDDDIVAGKALLGFRVPCIVASPWTKGIDPQTPRVYGTPQNQTVPFDHTSVLKLIEWRHNLLPLTARDASEDVGNLRDVLDFTNPNPVPPDLPLPPPPPPSACPNDGPVEPPVPLPDRIPPTASDSCWAELRASGLLDGWGL